MFELTASLIFILTLFKGPNTKTRTWKQNHWEISVREDSSSAFLYNDSLSYKFLE